MSEKDVQVEVYKSPRNEGDKTESLETSSPDLYDKYKLYAPKEDLKKVFKARKNLNQH